MAVNGRSYDFESATFKASGLTTTTIVNATYAGGRNVEIKTDTKGAPSRYTLGDYDGGEVTFEIVKAEAVQFLESLEEVPGGGILGAQFTATISYADTDQDETTDTLELAFQKIEDKPEKGKETMTTITCLQTAPMNYGGVDLMPASEGR